MEKLFLGPIFEALLKTWKGRRGLVSKPSDHSLNREPHPGPSVSKRTPVLVEPVLYSTYNLASRRESIKLTEAIESEVAVVEVACLRRTSGIWEAF